MTDIERYYLFEQKKYVIKLENMEDIKQMEEIVNYLIKTKIKMSVGIRFERYYDGTLNLPTMCWPESSCLFAHQCVNNVGEFTKGSKYPGMFKRAIPLKVYKDIEKYTEYLI